MATTQHAKANTTIIPGVSQNMSLKIGRSAAELSKPCFTAGTSRVLRSRAAKAVGIRSKRKPVSPQSPPSPNQESAVNPRTGKVAFGPWLGPYATNAENTAASSEPLFLDHNGNTYASLNSHLKGVLSPQAPMPAATGKAAAATTAATQQLYAMVGKFAQRSAAAAAQAQARAPLQWPGHGKPHGSGRCGNTMARSINQPRRS